MVVLAVPYDGHDELVASLPLAGKTVVSCVNPLAFDKRGAHGQVIDARRGIGRRVRPAPGARGHRGRRLPQRLRGAAWGDDDYLDEDVLCVGDSDEGKAVAMELANAVTWRRASAPASSGWPASSSRSPPC